MVVQHTFESSEVVPFNEELAKLFIQRHETASPTQPLERFVEPQYINALVEVLNQYWLTPKFTLLDENDKPRSLIFKIVHDDLNLDPFVFFKAVTGQEYSESSMGLFEKAIDFFVNQYK